MEGPNFAPDVRVNAYSELKKEFIQKILELPWAFISDESSLLDFTLTPGPPVELWHRIKTLYGVDVSDIQNGNVADVLERIASKMPRRPES